MYYYFHDGIRVCVCYCLFDETARRGQVDFEVEKIDDGDYLCEIEEIAGVWGKLMNRCGQLERETNDELNGWICRCDQLLREMTCDCLYLIETNGEYYKKGLSDMFHQLGKVSDGFEYCILVGISR